MCGGENLRSQTTKPVEIRHIGSYHTGIFDGAAAEITAYDEIGKRLFFTNGSANTVEVLDISDPNNPAHVNSIDLNAYGDVINSIIVWDGFLAAAIQNSNAQLNGVVVFMDTAGMVLNQLTVGPLPDMISISPDHNKIVVANEGEPDDDYLVDPNSSISIIDVSSGNIVGLTSANVTTIDFTSFESYRQSFESSAIDNWNYTLTPTSYATETDSIIDGNEDIWGVIQEFTGDIDNACHGDLFIGGQDLDNGNGGGSFVHTIDFDPVALVNTNQAYLSFKYQTIGYDGTDSAGYYVEFDNGTTWNNYTALSKDTTWNKVSIAIPLGSTHIRLRLAARQNGSTDYIGFDDVELRFFDESVNIYGANRFASVAQDLEPEYVCIDGNSQLAHVTLQENNAFATIDLNTAQIISVTGLGYKDHSLPGNGLDASNTNPTINITNWPIKGMYQPDAMSCYEVAGTKYYVFANEGDSRDYDGYSEEERVKDVTLDATVFPNAATLQLDDELGRLKITSSKGDIDCDGEYEEIYSYGSRSFSIVDENGNLVYDSGDDFEQITATEYPLDFNSTDDDNTSFKNRSDDKGPEPEGLAMAKINNRHYAFIGLERIGGIMVYDVSDPTAPQYLQYLNRRDFSQNETDSAALDLAPEGLVFIPKAKSPNKRDLLVVSNEISGTVSIYQIDINNTINGPIALDTFGLNSPDTIGTYGQMIYEGGISGLLPKPGTNDQYFLITDRGPNVSAVNHNLATGMNEKLFPFVNYAPKVIEVTANAGVLAVDSSYSLSRPSGTNVTGLPLPAGLGNTGETAWSDTLANLAGTDAWGIDSEGLTIDNQGNYWVCDEYGASVWQLNSNFQVIKRYTPFTNELEDVQLDTMAGKRRPNRGFEGVAYTPNGKVYAILQSPVYNPGSVASDNSRIHRIIEIDPATGDQNTYAYEHNEPIGDILNKDWKLGDLVAINNTEFLVIEHAQKGAWNYKDVYKIDISGATPITVEDFGGLTLEELQDSVGLDMNGITVVEKTHVLDLLENGWDLNHDKPEGIAVLNDTTIALVNDNDYGISSPNSDGNVAFTGATTRLYQYTLPNSLNLVSPFCEVEILTADTTICPGDLVTVDAEAGFASYDWNDLQTGSSVNFGNAGQYYVNATNANGCVASDTFNLSEHTLPGVALGTDQIICINHDITLDAGAGFTDYDWSTGGTLQTELITGSSLGVGVHTIDVLATDMNGCNNSDTLVLTVDACTDIDQPEGFKMNVYPNPVLTNLNLENKGQAPFNVQLINILGETIQTMRVDGQNTQSIDMTAFASGTYFIKVFDGEKEHTLKLLKL